MLTLGDDVGVTVELLATPVMLASRLGDVGELEPPPNILFSSPPDEEKLLRCLPASLPTSGCSRLLGCRVCSYEGECLNSKELLLLVATVGGSCARNQRRSAVRA